MATLATAIYDVLRTRVPGPKPEISYSELVARLPSPWNNLTADSEQLAQALGELVTRCRAKGLPAISAMVVRQHDGVPGRGYYTMAHPSEAGDIALAMVAWGNELLKVRQTTYPASI